MRAAGLEKAPGWRIGVAVTAVMGVAVVTAWWGPGLLGQEREGDADDLHPPDRVAEDGQVELVARYRAAAEESDAPLDWYNYGTALLGAERWTEARESLRRAAPAENPTVELYARYNQALASARSGREDPGTPDERRERLIEARDAFRAVLRRTPRDEDARWNLELVQSWLREQPGGGGGGAGTGQASSTGAGSAQPQGGEESGAPVELRPDEAAALLEAAGQAESSVRDRLLGRARLRDPVVERNW